MQEPLPSGPDPALEPARVVELAAAGPAQGWAPARLAQLGSLLGAVALLLAGNGLLGTLLALRLAGSGFGASASSVMLAAYFAGIVVGTLRAGRTIARVGHIRLFGACTALLSSIALLHALLAPGWSWALLRFASGLAMAGLYMTLESWIQGISRPEQRGRLLAAYLVAVYGGLSVGQVVLALGPETGFALPATSAILFSLSAIPIALTRQVAPTLSLPERLPLRELVDRVPLAFVAVTAAGILCGTIYVSLPLAGHALGLPNADVAWWLGAALLGGLVFQPPLGRLSDTFDRRAVLLGLALAVALLCAWLGWRLPDAGPTSLVAIAVLGGLCFAVYPIGVAQAFERIEPRLTLPAASQLLLASGVGAALGPPAAAQLVELLGPAGLFLFDGVVGLALAAVAVQRLRSTRWLAPADREHFLPLARTSTVLYDAEAPAEADGPATGPGA